MPYLFSVSDANPDHAWVDEFPGDLAAIAAAREYADVVATASPNHPDCIIVSDRHGLEITRVPVVRSASADLLARLS